MSAGAYDAVVIGGDSNGLVAAARLAGAGLSVLVLEGEELDGGDGRLVEFAPGFCAAPLSLEPGWVPRPVARLPGLSGLEPVAAEVPLSVAVEPGRFLTLPRDGARAAAAIAAHSRSDAAKWAEFTALLHRLSGFLEALYQAPAPDVDARSAGEWLSLLSLARKLRTLGARDMTELLRLLPMPVRELLDDWFECAPLKAAVATAGIQGLQQGPRSGGTSFVLLHQLVGAQAGAVRGRLPWRGGPGAFRTAAGEAARRSGATLRAGAKVASILVRDDAVAGVVLADGDEIAAGRVLSTADPVRTLLDWIDPVWLDPEFLRDVSNVRHRGCTAYVLFALDALPEPGGLEGGALAGVVSLTPDLVALERAADAAKYGDVAPAPHVELTVPTLLWPDLAPPGRHVLVATVHYAPFELKGGASWDEARRAALAEAATQAIERHAEGFRSRVLHRAVLSPRDLETRFGLREGAASQGELALDQILFMRPVPGWGRHATPIAGLFLGGVGTHPGPGVLGGAGSLAADALLRAAKVRAAMRSP